MENMFNSTAYFNQDISGWDVSNVTNMVSMFKDAASFNMDLTSWCVVLIPTYPTDFALGSALISAYYPVWGASC